MDAKGRKMIDREFSPKRSWHSITRTCSCILQTADACTPGTLPANFTCVSLAELVARGLGECDNSAVIRAFEGES